MEIVQLGLFSSVYNWVYDKILDPLWEWVSGLLSSGFKYLAEIVPNVIGSVMDTLFGKVIDIILEWYFSRWYVIQAAILLLLDCIEDCFNVVSGLSPVYIHSTDGSSNVQGVPMLFAVFNQKTVQNAFMTMIVVGFSVCFAMAIIAVARNFFELGSDKTKPVTHIIRMTAKSILYLAIAPLLAVALILLSQAILKTIDRAVSFGSEQKTSMARIIFCISSLDAVDEDAHSDGAEYNISYDKGPSKASLTDKYREKYYYKDENASVPNYVNLVTVAKTFKFRGFDYIVGIGCGIFFTVIMCMVLAVFIGRIFDVIVLVIIQPFFVGMMPFDDGEYYKRWFELFLGKLFQGFGSVIAMRVYLLILEQLFSGQIRFSNSSSVGSRLQDYLMMLLFAMGGGVAVRHIGPLVTGILSQSAAYGEQMAGYEGLKVGQTIAGKELGVAKNFLTADASRVGKLLGKSGSLAGMAAGTIAGRFMGKGRTGAASAADGGQKDSEPGKFENKSRPQSSFAPMVSGLANSVQSAAQKNLSSVKAAAPSGMGGQAGGNKADSGQSMQDIVSGSNNAIPGQSMQDIVSGGSNGDSGGSFNSRPGNAGSGQSMQGIVSNSNAAGSGGSFDSRPGNAGSGQFMQDIVSNSSNAGSGQSMQDIVSNSNNPGNEQSMQDILGANGNDDIQGGAFDDPLNTGFYMDNGSDEDDDQ